MNARPEPVPISTDGIRLGQFLKLVGLAGTGGEAKAMLEAGVVEVNGSVEERRGAQLVVGDNVVVDGTYRFRLVATS
jgi:ribosome-associated protein